MKKKIENMLWKEVPVEMIALKFKLKDGTVHHTKKGWSPIGGYLTMNLIHGLGKRTMHKVTGVGMVPNERIVSIAVVPLEFGKAKVRRGSDDHLLTGYTIDDKDVYDKTKNKEDVL